MEEGKEKERERNIYVWEEERSVASRMLPNGNLAHNPDMCPDWESNRQPSGLQSVLNPLSHICQGYMHF